MRWGKRSSREEDRGILRINSRCSLVGIPPEAHDYTVSGRSPLQWAIDSLRMKHDNNSGIMDDPNKWHAWADEPFNLIRHLRRLVRVSVETTRIVAGLPPSLPVDDTVCEATAVEQNAEFNTQLSCNQLKYIVIVCK